MPAQVDPVVLEFGADGAPPVTNLSGICRDGKWLWLAGDESPSVERLTASEPPRDLSYAEHRSFAIGDFVELPEGRDEEIDVEGLDRQGSYLWLTGSHSRTRKRVKSDDGDVEAIEKLAEVADRPNRHVIVKLPLVDTGDGGPVPVGQATTTTGAPLNASVLVGDLTDRLTSDAHLGPFLSIPSKDNGLDIEGLVALDGQLLVGLRGPVLRGWAVVLELEFVEDAADPRRLTLASYRKHFLDLDGLGVRDLCKDGGDILVLAGPTMDLDGPARVYRWSGAITQRDVLIRAEAMTHIDLAFGIGNDHPEGITTSGPASGDILTVYDSPSARRVGSDGSMLADRLSNLTWIAG